MAFARRKLVGIESLTDAIKEVIGDMFPVGTVILSKTGKPNLPGTWERLSAADDRYIRLNATGGSTYEAGLPNIKGTLRVGKRGDTDTGVSGAFTSSSFDIGTVHGAISNGMYKATFDASRSNSIYGASDTVRPKTYTLVAYIRTA